MGGTAVMPDGSFKELALGDFAGKWVVLYFYPLDFTFVCPIEICAFSDRAGEFEKLNTQLVGVSVDSKFATWRGPRCPATRAGSADAATLWWRTSRRPSPRTTAC